MFPKYVIKQIVAKYRPLATFRIKFQTRSVAESPFAEKKKNEKNQTKIKTN